MHSLFHRIRKSLFYLSLAALAGALVFLVVNRHLFHPVVDLYEAFRIKEGFQQELQGDVQGKVVKVLEGDTFEMRDRGGKTYRVRLTGLDAPDYQYHSPSALARAKQAKTNLMDLVLSNDIRVAITYSTAPYSVIGLAYDGETNLNARAIELGIGEARRDYMNGLPLKARWELLSAERKAAGHVLAASGASDPELPLQSSPQD